MGVDHRVAADPECKCLSILGSIDRARIERDVSLNGLLGQRCHARRNLAVNWNVADPDFLHWRNECPRSASVAIEQTFSLQRREVLHHGSLASEPEMMLDLPRARRDPFFALFRLNEFQNVSLPFGQHIVRMAEKSGGRKFK